MKAYQTREASGGDGLWPGTRSLEIGSNREGTVYQQTETADMRRLFPGDSDIGGGYVVFASPVMQGGEDGSWALSRQGDVCFSESIPEWYSNPYGLSYERRQWINFLTNGNMEVLTGLSGQIPAIGVR